MKPRTSLDRAAPARIELQDGARVAVIGGGPAGAFFCLHLLRKARALGRRLQLTLFERRRCTGASTRSPCGGAWHGCNYCAGGLSPKLNDVLDALNLKVPEAVVQSRIHRVTIQGFWKNIELEVPAHRRMLSVFRGSRPGGESPQAQSFDSFLLDQALADGAALIQSEVVQVTRSAEGKPVVHYRAGGVRKTFEADFAVFATGVNEHPALADGGGTLRESLRALMPRFVPPRTRRTLIFEVKTTPAIPAGLRNGAFFVEYGSPSLPVEMSSLLPKRTCVTVVLVGKCADRANSPADTRAVIRSFLDLPHIRRLFPAANRLDVVCVCKPRMVTGSARRPFADRVSAVGDLVTARLYKDGILSAEQTARALAEAALVRGIDEESLEHNYGPTLRRFARNNRFASLVFFLHRFVFSSSVLSRVLYQAVITERKSTPAGRRRLEQILWRIASGDDEYEDIFRCMLRPAAIWAVLTGGALVTLRNYLTELAFGVRWEGLGRFTTGVSLERLEEKRREFGRLAAEANIALPPDLEFERMYTIKMAAPRERILDQLEHFGEPDRGWLRPRGVRIRRVAGEPHEAGCVIRYEIGSPRFYFHLRLEQVYGGHLAVYRVMDGFARGGVLLFEIESDEDGMSLLSIYVAFRFARGRNWATRLFWRMFRLLFPAYVHDVLWNHSLCQMRDLVETRSEPARAPGRFDPDYAI